MYRNAAPTRPEDPNSEDDTARGPEEEEEEDCCSDTDVMSCSTIGSPRDAETTAEEDVKAPAAPAHTSQSTSTPTNAIASDYYNASSSSSSTPSFALYLPSLSAPLPLTASICFVSFVL